MNVKDSTIIEMDLNVGLFAHLEVLRNCVPCDVELLHGEFTLNHI